MTGFSERFRHLHPPTDTAIGRALKTGLVSLDANVLLDAYRYAPEPRTELLSTLSKLGDRLWVSHQAALEFHRNRVSVIASHDDTYRSALEAIAQFRTDYIEQLEVKLHEFSQRVALTGEEEEKLSSPITHGIDRLVTKLESLRSKHGTPEGFSQPDAVLAQLENLLDDKVGPVPEAEEFTHALVEAERRVASRIPPGFRDGSKSDPSGDYLVWIQSLREAQERDVPLIFVTRDVKDDWFLRVKGKTVSARPELVAEARDDFGIEFLAMTTSSFLRHAQVHLDANVSAATLNQAEAIRASDGGGEHAIREAIVLPAEYHPVLMLRLRDEERQIENERQALLTQLDEIEDHDSDHARSLMQKLDAAVERAWGMRDSINALEEYEVLPDGHLRISAGRSNLSKLIRLIDLYGYEGSVVRRPWGSAHPKTESQVLPSIQGHRQHQIIGIGGLWSSEGITTGAISSTIGYDQPNVYNTLQTLKRRRVVERADDGKGPQRWRVTREYREASERELSELPSRVRS